MCYRTLRNLVKAKKIKKGPRSIEEPAYYYIDEAPGQPFHTIGVNWVWIWFEKRKRYQEGDTVETFATEPTEYLPVLRPDAFVTVKNTPKKCRIFYFIEFDVYESGHKFEKPKKYNDLFDAISKKKVSYPWLKETNGFPQVTVVTTGPLEVVKKALQIQNRNSLDFEVWTYQAIKDQCLKET